MDPGPPFEVVRRPRPWAGLLKCGLIRSPGGRGKSGHGRDRNRTPGQEGRCYTFEPPVPIGHLRSGRLKPLGANGFDGVVNLGERAEVPVGLVNQRAKHNSQ